jgi:dTDP-4-dehydrorhamnose 3,5-epimerase
MSRHTIMDTKTFPIKGPIEFMPQSHGDYRGYFAETFRDDDFAAALARQGDVAPRFVQENQSLSAAAGTVRGLHFQSGAMAQGKLVRCVAGAIWDVAVDIRPASPSFGQWVAVELTAAALNQVWVPPGFAHGFCTLQPNTIVAYKVTEYYSPAHDHGLAWDDPALGIDWPAIACASTLSAKDRTQPKLAQLRVPACV